MADPHSPKKGESDDENTHIVNYKERVNDYSARVRLINKEKIELAKKVTKKADKIENKQKLYSIDRPSTVIEEKESEISELTEDCVTSYQKYKDNSQSFNSYYRQKSQTNSDDKASLKYSESSEDKDTDSDTSDLSNYYSKGKNTYYRNFDKTGTSVDTDFASYRKKFGVIEGSTDRSRVTNDSLKNTDGLLTNYKKLLTEIRGVIKSQRESILR